MEVKKFRAIEAMEEDVKHVTIVFERIIFTHFTVSLERSSGTVLDRAKT